MKNQLHILIFLTNIFRRTYTLTNHCKSNPAEYCIRPSSFSQERHFPLYYSPSLSGNEFIGYDMMLVLHTLILFALDVFTASI